MSKNYSTAEVWVQVLTVSDVLGACEGVFHGDASLLEQKITVITGSLNEIRSDCIYIATEVDANVDPKQINSNIAIAFRKGALCCVTSKDVTNKKIPHIKVKDFSNALAKIGSLYRSSLNVPIISITGSNGKTCTRDMLVSVLTQELCTLKIKVWPGQVYNELFYLREHHEAAVVETAAGGKNSNIRNGKLLHPDIVVMTNIDTVHLHNLDEGAAKGEVFFEKKKLLEYLSPVGIAYINGNDEYLKTITLKKPQSVRVYGFSESMDYYPANIKYLGLKGINCDLNHGDICLNVTIPTPGKQFINSALISFAIGLDFGVSLPAIKAGIESFKPSGRRVSVIETGFLTILDDCYNASPASVRAALDILSTSDQRKVFFFGGIAELGAYAERYHREVAENIADSSVDLAVFSGEYAGAMADTIKKRKSTACQAVAIPELSAVVKRLPEFVRKDDLILVKASRTFHLEDITKQLEKMHDDRTMLNPPVLVASNAVLFDSVSGKILYEKNATEQQKPASLLKIATCMVALENGNLDAVCVIPDVLKTHSAVGVKPGEKFVLADMLYGLMLKSDNALAEAVAITISGSIKAFMGKVNDLAKYLGMRSTVFVNPHGLGAKGQLTSAYDMALLARHAFKNAIFRKIIATPLYECRSSLREYAFKNTNLLINHHSGWNSCRYHNCLGGKTGSLRYPVGKKNCVYFNLLSVAAKDEQEHILVQMNHQYTIWPDSKEESEAGVRFRQAKLLHEWGFDNWSTLTATPYSVKG